ncbi:MAG: hypothetical protein AAFX76_08925 [Planctomycetota bacterium]
MRSTAPRTARAAAAPPAPAALPEGHTLGLVSAVIDERAVLAGQIELHATGPGAWMAWTLDQSGLGAADRGLAEDFAEVVEAGRGWWERLTELGVLRVGWVLREADGEATVSRTSAVIVTDWPGDAAAAEVAEVFDGGSGRLARHGRLGDGRWVGVMAGADAPTVAELNAIEPAVGAAWREAAEPLAGSAAWVVWSPTAALRELQVTRFEQTERDVRQSVSGLPDGEAAIANMEAALGLFKAVFESRWLSAGLWLGEGGTPDRVRAFGRAADEAAAAAFGPRVQAFAARAFANQVGVGPENPGGVSLLQMAGAALVGEAGWRVEGDRVRHAVRLAELDWRPLIEVVAASRQNARRIERMNALQTAALRVVVAQQNGPDGAWPATLDEAYGRDLPGLIEDPTLPDPEGLGYAPPDRRAGAVGEPGVTPLLFDRAAWDSGEPRVAVVFIDGHAEWWAREDPRLTAFAERTKANGPR